MFARMSSLSDRLHNLADASKGRCHSCVHQHVYDLPTGTRYWCRAFDREMDSETRNAIVDCPQWHAVRIKRAAEIAETNPLLQPHLQDDDHLFWRLKCYLDSAGLDLRTIMILANGPSITADDLDWIKSLDDRFGPEDPGRLRDILQALDGLGYSPVAKLVERVLRPEKDEG